jgi:hypothetical protein
MDGTYQIVELLTEQEGQVLDWRFDTLSRAGFDAELAFQLASTRRIDVHEVLRLVYRGCPPQTAARILI